MNQGQSSIGCREGLRLVVAVSKIYSDIAIISIIIYEK